MSKYDYDLFVIGAGSGGIRAARMAAATGIKVAVAEQARTGGTCVNLGCVPKKLYVHATEYGAAFSAATGFGWQATTPELNWATLRDNKSALLSTSNQAMENMLAKSGAELIRGRARVLTAHSVEVAGTSFSAARILIATGSHPVSPTIPGREHLLSSDQIFDLERLPERILIIGGGYIASEFAGIFNGLGVKVCQLYRGDLFLRGFDAEIRQFVAGHMRRKGIDLRFNCDVEKVEKEPDGSYTATLNDGSLLTTDLVLAATGRRPNISELGLEQAGVELTAAGAVKVDDFYQTSIPSIFAIGDVIDRMQLTPVALAEAMTLVKHLYQGGATPLSYQLIPTAVFSNPPFSGVGLSEEEACQRYPQVDIYTTEFRALKHALSGSGDRILIKLIVERNSDRVIGAHMAGEGAAEIIQGVAVALKAGATKAIFDQTVGIHPTSAEEFVTLRTMTRSHNR